ncbi:MAG TPA: GDP-mannose 4,6-dehydratase [Gemmatimonadales bacterium]|nr:GDP-mannose 4,6-dehydratase [Gemmatimonadales bacterium]
MKALVTGADGFVGTWVVRRLLADGWEVTGGVQPARLGRDAGAGAEWVPLEVTDADSVRRCMARPFDAVIHLAAVASVSDAAGDPGQAWEVNAAGTARLVEAIVAAKRAGTADPLLLVVSTGEVYGRGDATPRRETDPAAPCSSYAASKLGAEVAALEGWRRAGVRTVVVRAFPHTGPGQDPRFVVPAFVQRLRQAKRTATATIKVGNLAPVREFLHVADVVDAYVRLLASGEAGEVYNVASGRGVSVAELLDRLAKLVGVCPKREVDPALVRATDIPYLIGDAAKLRACTGWAPRHSLEETLQDVIDAQAD